MLPSVAMKEHDRYVQNRNDMVKAVKTNASLPPRVAKDLAEIEVLAEQHDLKCTVAGYTASVIRDGHNPVTSTLTPRSCRDGVVTNKAPPATPDDTTWYECACTCKKKPQVRSLVDLRAHVILRDDASL